MTAAPKNNSPTTKFLVGSGSCPLKVSNARPATKPAKIAIMTYGENSSVSTSSFEPRRRRVLLEAIPRFTSLFRFRKSNMTLFARAAGRRRAVLLIGVNDRADKLVPHHIALVEIVHRDSGHRLQRLQGFD